jgi:hypothetical protein
LFSVNALVNSLQPLAKIAYLPLPHQLWPHCAMPPANQRSYTVAKEISEFVSPLPNVYLGYVIPFRLAHH